MKNGSPKTVKRGASTSFILYNLAQGNKAAEGWRGHSAERYYQLFDLPSKLYIEFSVQDHCVV